MNDGGNILEFRLLLIKVFEKCLRDLGLFRLIFNKPKIKQGEPNFRLIKPTFARDIKTRTSFLELELVNKKSIFGKLVDLKVLEENSEKDRQFWKLKWKADDPKDFWEVARGWQWLPVIIEAKKVGKENFILEKIVDWFNTFKYPKGLAWAVGLDVAIRSINLLLIYLITGDKRLVDLLYVHKHYLEKALWISKGTMRNNHYLGEITGLAILSKFFGENRQDLMELIAKEFKNQFYSDGVNVEQSIRYHKFSLEFLLISISILNIELDINLLEKTGEFLLACMKPSGDWPSIGDDDLGCVLRLHEDPLAMDYKSVLSTLSILTKRGDFKYVSKNLSAETKLLFPESKNIWKGINYSVPQREFIFKQGGYYSYRTSWDSNANWILVKYGPHMWHAHADLFHIELVISGIPILIDSGTFRYFYKFGRLDIPELRRYFRSTTAHNTMVFNNSDQTEQKTVFRWGKSAKVIKTNVEQNHDRKLIILAHNGYERFGIIHHRKIEFESNLKYIKIVDTPLGNGKGSGKVVWNFFPGLELVRRTFSTFEILKDGVNLGNLSINSDFSHKIETKKTPYSPSYGTLSEKLSLFIEFEKSDNKEKNIITTFKFK